MTQEALELTLQDSKAVCGSHDLTTEKIVFNCYTCIDDNSVNWAQGKAASLPAISIPSAKISNVLQAVLNGIGINR